MNRWRQWCRPLPFWTTILTIHLGCLIVAPQCVNLYSNRIGSVTGNAICYGTGAFAVYLLFGICLHEAGHGIGGYGAGFHGVEYAAGPLRIRRTARGWRFQVNPSGTLGGRTLAVPLDAQHLRRRFALFIAGGPAANLAVFGMVGGGIAGWIGSMDHPLVELNHFLQRPFSQYVFMLGFEVLSYSLFLGVFNLVPISRGGLKSDGAQLLLLWRGGPRAERFAALCALAAASTSGIRPREWNRAFMQKMTPLADRSPEAVLARMMAYFQALDERDEAGAETHLRQAIGLADTDRVLKPVIQAETAYFEARFRGHPVLARALLDQARGEFVEQDQRLTAETAILLSEGRLAEAQERARDALAAYRQSPVCDAGIAVMYQEWLRHVCASQVLQPGPAAKGSVLEK